MSTPIITLNKREKKTGNFFYGILFIAAVALGLAFIAPEKKYKIELSREQWEKSYKWIGIAKQALSKSSLPASDVYMVNDSLDFFQQEMARQLSPQFKLEDSLSKIKPK